MVLPDSVAVAVDDRAPEKPKLKWAVLVPFSAVVVLVVALFSYTTYLQEQQDLEHEARRVSSSIQYLYQKGIFDHAEILAAATESITHDELIAAALIRNDRQRLLVLSRKHFSEIKAKYGITHWYFTGKDRVNLLRVHQPKRHGDTINRFTMMEAERTGSESFGMEIGPLGTFTLRYVYPWYVSDGDRSTLIGYVEVGMEVEHLFDEIENMMDVGISVFIEKSLLKRERWEEGVKMLGRVPNWDRFENLVSTAFRQEKVAAPLLDQFASGGKSIDIRPLDMSSGEVNFRVVPVSLKDVRKEHIGYAVAFMDITSKSMAARDKVVVALVIAIIVGLSLFAFFYRLLGSTEERLVKADKKLRAMATHDGLTGLLNHRMFQNRLEEESQRAARYGKQVTMLMIDVDFFKKVNDNYGHSTGDFVLQRISKLITNQCRNIDTICRYGGEEIAVLLPETPLEEGVHAAERIRMHIASDSFEGSGVENLKVTASIGVSAFPSHAGTPSELAQSADAALYLAKDSGRNKVVATKKTVL